MTSLNIVARTVDVPAQDPLFAQAQPVEIPDRYELKYLISECQVDAIRRAIEPYCALDPHSAKAPGGQYAIRSLYLDTPNRDLYRISRERRACRWKARIRGYEGSNVVFLEVKNKDHDLIKKLRARIPAGGWDKRIQGPLYPGANSAERMFCHKLERYGLVPTLMVRYMREAWMSTIDNYARVTFDRCVVCQPWEFWGLDCDERNWLALDSRRSMLTVPQGVVLELKCTTAVPRWLSNVARDMGLTRARYSKYCKGIERFWARDTLLGLLHQA
jgi:hypothetical protein